MSARAHILVLLATLLSLALIVRQVRLRRLRAKYALLWLLVALALTPLALAPGLLDASADLVGIAYGPALLLVIGFAFFALLSLHFSYELSRLEERARALAEETALMRERLEALEGERTNAEDHGERIDTWTVHS